MFCKMQGCGMDQGFGPAQASQQDWHWQGAAAVAGASAFSPGLSLGDSPAGWSAAAVNAKSWSKDIRSTAAGWRNDNEDGSSDRAVETHAPPAKATPNTAVRAIRMSTTPFVESRSRRGIR
jgi:hypothetical protein